VRYLGRKRKKTKSAANETKKEHGSTYNREGCCKKQGVRNRKYLKQRKTKTKKTLDARKKENRETTKKKILEKNKN